MCFKQKYIYHREFTGEKHILNLRRKKHLQQCHTYQSVCISSKSNLPNLLIKKGFSIISKWKDDINTDNKDSIFWSCLIHHKTINSDNGIFNVDSYIIKTYLDLQFWGSVTEKNLYKLLVYANFLYLWRSYFSLILPSHWYSVLLMCLMITLECSWMPA